MAGSEAVGIHVSECLSTCEAIFKAYRSESPPEQDYAQYSEQAEHLTRVHSVLIDTAILKLKCLATVIKPTDLAGA